MTGPIHAPVLADEVVRALVVDPRPSFLVDATVGAGGHAERLLEASDATLLGIDRDPAALAHAAERLRRFGDRVTLVRGTFRSLPDLVAGRPVDGLVADLGVSSMQLDEASRGFSFRSEGPIDMRMDPASGRTAGDLLASIDETVLADAIYELGGERRSRRIARSIVRAREAGRLSTTLDLAAAVRRAHGPRRGSIDPATRTFQALRMLVNDELGELDALLSAIPSLLGPGGRAAILSFHSLEDRRVKEAFRHDPSLLVVSRKPIRATEEERVANPRARSAKLRVAARRAP